MTMRGVVMAVIMVMSLVMILFMTLAVRMIGVLRAHLYFTPVDPVASPARSVQRDSQCS